MAAVEISIGYTPAQGIPYTWQTDTLSDVGSVPSDRYFFDKGTKLIYYKDTLGVVQGIFRQFPAVQTVTSAATVTPTYLNDEVVISALAVDVTIANATGTFKQGQAILMTIKDAGVAKNIAWGNKYVGYGDALPSITTAGKNMLIPIFYDAIADKFMVTQSQVEQ